MGNPYNNYKYKNEQKDVKGFLCLSKSGGSHGTFVTNSLGTRAKQSKILLNNNCNFYLGYGSGPRD